MVNFSTKMKKPLPVLKKVQVSTIASEGKAVAKYGDKVIFIPFVIPGDVIDIQLTKSKKSYAEGFAVYFHEYSQQRNQPFCSHYGICGGCKWQILPYPEQLRYKQQQIFDNLTRIGKVELPEIATILPSEKTQFYRNKLEYTFSNNCWVTEDKFQNNTIYENRNALGFHISNCFDKVLDINRCYLQSDVSNVIRLSIKDFCLKNNYTFFDLRNQTGLMRNLIIRTSQTGEMMLIVVFFENDEEKRNALLHFIDNKFPEITSLLYIINSKANDSTTDQIVHLFKGRDYILEQMGKLQFKISAKSFYQTNSFQAYKLYQIICDFASLTGKELVYDLYTGIGTIANFIACKAQKVIGIEYIPEAIEDARVNSEINNINNTLFFVGDVKDILTPSFVTTYGYPEVIIVDTPRAGMHSDVIDTLLFAFPRKIVYASCNPTTQARDLNSLNCKYKVTRIQPIDMFPHTHHVENVVLLEKREII